MKEENGTFVTGQEKEEKQDDLVTRVSQVKTEPKEEEKFNVNDIENIQDPKAKEYAEKAYKSLQGDYTRKYQALAEERKAWEAKKAESDKWTEEKVQSLLKDPSFVQAAQSVASPQEDYSTLSDAEKKRIEGAEKLAREAIQANAQLLKQQQYENLKGKYANFDPTALDTITAEVIKQKRQITYEDIWKAKDYEDAVQRAYKLGKQDKNVDNQEKITSMSAEGGTVISDKTIAPEKEESSKSFWNRIIAKNLAEKSQGQIRK